MSGFLDPVSQVSHKVKEEVAIRHTDDLHNQKPSLSHLNVCDVSQPMAGVTSAHLVGDLHEQTETFRWFEQQTPGDVVAEVFGFGARLHFKHLEEQREERQHETEFMLDSSSSCSKGDNQN